MTQPATTLAASASAAALIALDWGTTSLRAYLFDANGNVLDTRASTAGIMNLPRPADEGGFDLAFDSVVGAWLDSAPHLPVIAAGMVGSAQGWKEAPYVSAPASADALVSGVVRVRTARGATLNIVPGVLENGELPNVMRGEETQILGALAAMGRSEGTFVLPGTHSKWARVEAGRITSFATYMTGEVFAALKDHTILGRLMDGAAQDGVGFGEGVQAAARLERPGDVLHAVFMTRTLGLFDRLPPHQLSDYLSGLLIGAELLSGARGAQSAVVIGSPALTARYCAAGAVLGLSLEAAPENCAALGQLALLPHWRGR